MGVLRRVLRVTALGGLCLTLSACGSQLTPTEVASANPRSVAGTPISPGDPGSAGRSPAARDIASDPGLPPDPDSPALGDDAAPGPGTTAPEPGRTGRDDDTTPAPDGDVPHRDCAGFHNQTGVTDSTITIANASDVAGPVPGLFESAQDAVEAFAAYFNAGSDICGRKLRVLPLDTRTDAAADQQAYATACTEAFAAVGSMAAFDSGGASEAQHCGLPDLRSGIVTNARLGCSTCFAAQSGSPDTSADVVPDHYRARYGDDAARHAGYLWIDAGPARENAQYEMRAWQRTGFTWAYSAAIGVSEFNYVPYVQRMREAGVQIVRFLGAPDQEIRLAKAMSQVGFRPKALISDSSAYDSAFVANGGRDVDGTDVFVNFTPFEDAHASPEMQLYLRWLQALKPGATPTFAGLFAWSAARLFAEQAIRLGGRLDRARLVEALRRVDDWTDHGLHPPQRVGAKTVGPCWRFLTLDDGRWITQGARRFSCGPVTRVR